MKGIAKLATAVAVLIAVVAAYVIIHDSGTSGYKVRLMMADAGGLQSGSNVNIDGATVGRVMSLGVTKNDRAVAMLKLNQPAAPIGKGATATVEIDGFFGERLVQLTRGDFKTQPEPSGSTIGLADTHVSVRLDDVLDSLNADAQGALRTFLDEEGSALVGRGQNVEDLLNELPQTLPQLTTLLDDFSSNQQAMGQLIQRSDQVVSELAPQRRYLVSLVNSGNSALSALASRRSDLGDTVQRAPGALKQAQTTLATLQGTAIPLAPASDGLRATAPSLLTALKEVGPFTQAAIPTLNEVSTVAPALDRLGADATPIVSQIQPLATELTSYTSTGLEPLMNLLDQGTGAENLFGLMEGWARSTQGYDASGHIFRFGAVADAQTLENLVSLLNTPTSATTPTKSSAAQTAPSRTGGSSTKPSANPVASLGNGVSSTVKNLTGSVTGVVSKLTGTVAGAVSTVTGVLGAKSSTSRASSTPTSSGLSSLLGYLTGR